MDNKKKSKENEPEIKEIADSELEQVSGGFLRRVESRIQPADRGDGNDAQHKNGDATS